MEQANLLVESGTSVNGTSSQMLPLTQASTRITLSNVPPFISEEFLRELSRHRNVVSPIKKVLSGWNSPPLKLFVIPHNRNKEFNICLHAKDDDFDHILFATSSNMKCFGCGEEGHVIRMCPSRVDPVQPGTGERHSATVLKPGDTVGTLVGAQKPHVALRPVPRVRASS